MLYVRCNTCGKFEQLENGHHIGVDADGEDIYDCHTCFYNKQDNLAYQESNGEFSNYEDWMESRGAVAYHPDTIRREC